MLRFTNRVIVIGGNGVLGKAIVERFIKGWEVTSIDFTENKRAKSNVILTSSWMDHGSECKQSLNGKYDSILCVAGSFTKDEAFDKRLFEQTQSSAETNLFPSLLAAHLATSYLTDMGLLMFTGAAAPFSSETPESLSYGLCKNMAHYLALNMSKRNELPSTSTVCTILPETIDTPGNREAMPAADFSQWVSPEAIADLIRMWCEGKNRPSNGSYALMRPKKSKILVEFV